MPGAEERFEANRLLEAEEPRKVKVHALLKERGGARTVPPRR